MENNFETVVKIASIYQKTIRLINKFDAIDPTFLANGGFDEWMLENECTPAPEYDVFRAWGFPLKMIVGYFVRYKKKHGKYPDAVDGCMIIDTVIEDYAAIAPEKCEAWFAQHPMA